MVEAFGTVTLLAGVGVLVFRPHDVPALARAAGRVAAFTVRGLKGLRNVSETAFAQGEKVLNSNNAQVGGLREDLHASFHKFDTLRSKFTTDMRNIGPFTPVDMLKNRLRSKQTQNQSQQKIVSRPLNTTDQEVASLNSSTQHQIPSHTNTNSTTSLGNSTPSQATQSKTHTSSGADFIARSIQEAALAEQQKKIFRGPLPFQSQ